VKRFFRSQIGFLLWGLAFWFPIAIVFFVLAFLLGNVEDVGRKIFLLLFPERFFYQGLGIALGLVIIYISGVILKTTKIRSHLSRVPILGLLFGGGDVITVDRLTSLSPCLFMYSPTLLSYGWILSEEKVEVGDQEAAFTLLNVYYPNVPTLVTGQVFPVRKDTVIRLGNPSKEVIDLLLYAFRSPSALKYLPWEDESYEEFEARASRFGINVDQK
jgi:uncharacterized membrane protein